MGMAAPYQQQAKGIPGCRILTCHRAHLIADGSAIRKL